MNALGFATVNTFGDEYSPAVVGFDMRRAIGTMVEVFRDDSRRRAIYDARVAASIGWTGEDLLRPEDQLELTF